MLSYYQTSSKSLNTFQIQFKLELFNILFYKQQEQFFFFLYRIKTFRVLDFIKTYLERVFEISFSFTYNSFNPC